MVERLSPMGTYGLWCTRRHVTTQLVAHAEGLGFRTIWAGGNPPADLEDIEELLQATEHAVVATSIVNIWRADPRELAAAFHRLEARYPGRLLLGLGSGHPEADPARQRPLASLAAYLDVLDAEGVPKGRRILAALGPKALQLAASRSLGAHPYLTPPSHTLWARQLLGPEAFLAPEQMLIAREHDEEARPISRGNLRPYLQMQNYTRMLRAQGFTDDDLVDGPSAALSAALTPHGATPRLADAARVHIDAGADHVGVQILPQREDPVDVLERIAALLLNPRAARPDEDGEDDL